MVGRTTSHLCEDHEVRLVLTPDAAYAGGVAGLRDMYYKKRRYFGLCGQPHCEVMTGDESFYCEAHAAEHAKRQRGRRKRVRLAKALRRLQEMTS